MAIYAIADLHLPGGDAKPMDLFGAQWERHFDRIADDWRARVGPDDCVLLPGDLSWAMRLEDALPDLNAIGALPGQKLILRGNHDYWWSAIGRVRAALPPGMRALQNDCAELGDAVVAGTRGWSLPGDVDNPDDERIYRREVLRLSLALGAAAKVAAGRPIVAMMHYPPLTDASRDTGFTQLLEQYGVRHAVYGHLHGAALRFAFRGEHRGVTYHQVSCDGLDFQLYKLPV
ncbi:MAG: phosphohydrolase [Clostridiales bacterium]|nr:phosphohydrolase [Clostridiales bacterium]